jgi:hypothetical protein
MGHIFNSHFSFVSFSKKTRKMENERESTQRETETVATSGSAVSLETVRRHLSGENSSTCFSR